MRSYIESDKGEEQQLFRREPIPERQRVRTQSVEITHNSYFGSITIEYPHRFSKGSKGERGSITSGSRLQSPSATCIFKVHEALARHQWKEDGIIVRITNTTIKASSGQSSSAHGCRPSITQGAQPHFITGSQGRYEGADGKPTTEIPLGYPPSHFPGIWRLVPSGEIRHRFLHPRHRRVDQGQEYVSLLLSQSILSVFSALDVSTSKHTNAFTLYYLS